ncbi:tetratricopeptide repeat protein [Pelotalea chapellei]|uniref:Tetratricopeptide repeat protein n=1 Tax=Pelotalea chapellei TaxID=44671 RepID=A0ABS5U973_9BACT|nr:tetratricopeptide repeat protein [Pelotalea chapellei]MBT1072219.1 tetratricopeptide repeat protein [Pelotalea chapellei]
MNSEQEVKPTALDGIKYYSPPAGFILHGRDGRVSIPWDGKPPFPLLDEDFFAAEQSGAPDYDMVGRGIYQALRLNPDCTFAADYAALLKDAYPHVISELGGQIIMLDAKEVDTPYLDRKINFLRIMLLLDPGNAGLCREIARTFADKGARLSTLHQAVPSWYSAEKYLKKALELDPDDRDSLYEYGEALYVLGRYDQAAEIWQKAVAGCDDAGKRKIEARIAAIFTGKLPLVPPVDYLTALAVAVEEHQAGRNDESAGIIEDVLADPVFSQQFPMNEIHFLLGTCYEEMGMMDEAAKAFKRS